MAVRDIIKKGSMYYLTWLLPSSTPLFYLFYEIMGINVIISYLLACVVAGTIFIPIYYWIFRKYEKKQQENTL